MAQNDDVSAVSKQAAGITQTRPVFLLVVGVLMVGSVIVVGRTMR